MAAVVEINSTLVRSEAPYRMGEGGTLIPKPPVIVHQNGNGVDVTAGYASIEWSWKALAQEDYAWWVTTILGGQPSAEFTQALLWDDLGSLVTYAHVTVHRPSFARINRNIYFDVKIILDQLII